jgi:hypothetical protein
MNWIKLNYDRFALLVAAAGLLGSSGFVIWKTQQFPSLFSEVETQIPQGKKLVPAEVTALEEATAKLDAPAVWKASHPGSLFISRPYLVVDGKLVDPLKKDSMLHPPVENTWLTEYQLDLLNPNILNEDPDGDGFTVLDEYLGGKTNPIDKESRPAYSTKLRLVRYIKRPFRLLFAAYDDDSYQINTLDLKQPSQFLKLGEPIVGTKFKVLKFEKKVRTNPATEAEDDVSELTVQNTETQEEVVLVYRKTADSPDSFAHFKFIWDGSEFNVKKGATFALKVEPKVQYKLIDINDSEAVITKIGTDQKITVPRLEAKAK